MDATPLSKNAPPAAADGALPSASQQAVEPPSPPGDAAAAGAGMRRTSGGEDDDEQVERFYALLDNIRAVRGMLGTATGGGAATAAAGRKRRAREAEPPWRPAFRMEDFEVEEVQSDTAPPPCCDGSKRNRWEGSCGARRRETAADGEEEKEKDGEVVEAKGPRRAQQHKARRAGVLAVDGPGSR